MKFDDSHQFKQQFLNCWCNSFIIIISWKIYTKPITLYSFVFLVGGSKYVPPHLRGGGGEKVGPQQFDNGPQGRLQLDS